MRGVMLLVAEGVHTCQTLQVKTWSSYLFATRPARRPPVVQVCCLSLHCVTLCGSRSQQRGPAVARAVYALKPSSFLLLLLTAAQWVISEGMEEQLIYCGPWALPTSISSLSDSISHLSRTHPQTRVHIHAYSSVCVFMHVRVHATASCGGY